MNRGGRVRACYQEDACWWTDVSNDPVMRSRLVEVTGRRTVPQVFIDGTPHGGFTDLLALDRDGALDALLGQRAGATGG